MLVRLDHDAVPAVVAVQPGAFAELHQHGKYPSSQPSQPPTAVVAGSHFSGMSTGAPLFLIMNTRNFAGSVPLAFRSTTWTSSVRAPCGGGGADEASQTGGRAAARIARL